MAFLQRIDGLVPADLVSGKLKRLQVHDVYVSAVRADVNPFVLVANDIKPLFFLLLTLIKLIFLLQVSFLQFDAM
jgi:hypothetical protein